MLNVKQNQQVILIYGANTKIFKIVVSKDVRKSEKKFFANEREKHKSKA